jgi:hypothetical protein
MRRGLIALLSTAALLSAAASAVTRPNGLYGGVRKGPTSPICRVGSPCDAPAQVTLIFSKAGKQAARIRSTKTTGSYRIGLAPGYYTVTTVEKIGIDRNIRPRTVHVRRDHWDKLNFFIDTGIR